MELAIPKSPEALVRRKVEEGHYSTEEEVRHGSRVSASLRR